MVFSDMITTLRWCESTSFKPLDSSIQVTEKQGLIPLLFGYFQIIQQRTDKIISFDPSQTALGTGNLIVSGYFIFADISAADHDRDWIACVLCARMEWSGRLPGR